MFDVVVNNSKGEQVSQFECPVTECTIGKARDNFVQLRGWKISPHHAVINLSSKGLFIKDKTGQNRVEVNGEDVESYGPINTSDKIVIGGYSLQIGLNSKSVADGEDFVDMKTVFGVHQHRELDDPKVVAKKTLELERSEKFKWPNHVHDELLNLMDQRRTDISNMDQDALRRHVEKMIKEVIREMGSELPDSVDKEVLLKDVLNEAVGLGPLEALLENDTITEIMVNKFDEIFIEQEGKLTLSDITFSSDDAVMTAIERIVSPLGRRIDESSPLVDARLKDGSRVNAIIPPLALRGPCLTIRKFAKQKLQASDLVNFGALNDNMVKFLETAVNNHMNILISGGTGSGKTTLLNVLSNFIPPTERIITVEDAAELKLTQPHLVSLESRPANLEGKGAVPIRDLVKNCLRMRPDRIVVGECRGGETLDMLQAMNTGHDGSLTTAHANTPRDMIARLEVMVMMSGLDLPVTAIREMVASAIHIIVQISRYSDGSRRITNITEVCGVESGTVSMQDIFRYKQEGFDENGKVKGHFEATGNVPEFYEEMRLRGLNVDMGIFA